jgi:integrase
MAYPFGLLFELLIATGQRREEAAGLDWSEVDRATALWTLPRERVKNDEANIIPLNRRAIAALDRAAGRGLESRSAWPRKGFVFSSTGRAPVSGHSAAKAKLDARMIAIARQDAQSADDVSLAPWRLHDARRTLATGLQRLGVRFEVTKAVLNHVSGSRSGIAGVYQRHGWGPEKPAALGAWARHIEGLIDPATATGNVIVLPKKSA